MVVIDQVADRQFVALLGVSSSLTNHPKNFKNFLILKNNVYIFAVENQEESCPSGLRRQS